MSKFARLALRLAVFALLGMTVLFAPKSPETTLVANAQEAKAPQSHFYVYRSDNRYQT